MRGWFQYESGAHAGIHEYAVVAQSVERFLGKEEVRQFKSAQQLQHKKKAFISSKTFFFIFVLTV